MNEEVVYRRCVHHALREAVARCPECRQFFCRECIVEHEDRVICAECLKRLVPAAGRSGARFAGVRAGAVCALGFLAAWLFFYEAGRALLQMPASFHDGTLWHSK